MSNRYGNCPFHENGIHAIVVRLKGCEMCGCKTKKLEAQDVPQHIKDQIIREHLLKVMEGVAE